MRASLAFALFMACAITAPLLAAPALAAPAHGQPTAQRPRKLGEYQSWTAATYGTGAEKVCYAFARARSIDGVPNRNAQNVMLVVTHRPQGRDQVAVQSAYTYARNAEVPVHVGETALSFYGAQSSAFARDGRAAVAAFRSGREASARGPGPNNRGHANDTFPLNGFSQAYDAISRECPARR